MNLPQDLRGIVTVLNTPFTEGDAIDVTGLEKHVEYALDAGVAGFLVPAMAGEVAFLTGDEREQIVAAVLKTVAGRVPVIGGASADTLDARLNWVRRMTALGCDGVLVSPPFISEAQYADEVRQLAAQKPRFLMLQDWSSTDTGVPVAFIARLFEDIPCFKCLKIEVANSGPKYTEMLTATNGRLHVSGGWAVTEMVDGLDRGVHAFMPTGLHWTYTRIYRLYEQGNRAAAQVLFERLRPVLKYSNQDLPCSIHFFKQLLQAQGIYATARIRQPLSNSIDEARCRDMTALALMLEYELGPEDDV